MEATAKDITVAAIDLGSNSFRLMVARISGGEISPLIKILAPVGLGQDLSSSGFLNQEAIERALIVLGEFK